MRNALKSLVSTATARYDSAALRPPQPPTMPLDAAATALQQRLRRWCDEGTDAVPYPLFAALALSADTGGAAAIAALACDLDGTYPLQAAGRIGGLWLRLAVKCNDLNPWRPRQPSDPWDSGYARDDEATLAAFVPRRATLIVVEGCSREAARRIEQALASRAASFRRPVRLLSVFKD